MGLKWISKKLGVHPSSVSRELLRGSTGNLNIGYRADLAEKRRLERGKRKGRPRKIGGGLEAWIVEKLHDGWSPEQISGRLKFEKQVTVSYETIYRYIKRDRQAGGRLYLCLRHGHRKRKRRFHVPRVRADLLRRKSIEDRPKVINERKRIGDWERDLMFGDSRKEALLTMVERKTLYTLLRKVKSKSPSEIAQKTIEALSPLGKDGCKSITNDNGFEFREHEQESQALDVAIYFTHPYSSWEKGTCENLNGLIRQYFPKNSPIEELNDDQTQKIQDRLNARPRKKLGFRTPAEVFSSEEQFALIL